MLKPFVWNIQGIRGEVLFEVGNVFTSISITVCTVYLLSHMQKRRTFLEGSKRRHVIKGMQQKAQL